MSHIIPPGSTIGIMGGGQLAQMATLAAVSLGYHTHIYSPEPNCPARFVAHKITLATYENKAALKTFAESVDVITFEFENIPAESVQFVEAIVPVRPRWKALEISQNRLKEKAFFNEQIGIKTADYRAVRSLKELKEGFKDLGGEKAILKTAELGYDGKGQHVVHAKTNLEKLWREASMEEGVLEAFVPFEKEISVIIARNEAGETKVFPPAENVHENGILATSTAPAWVADGILQAACDCAKKAVDALQLKGLLAIEFFVTKEGELLVNEMAPRPHNSGHWTMDGCVTSQFEQFIRAVCGLPLGAVEMHSRVTMRNLIGTDVNGWAEILKDPSAKLHLYGKREARAGRKMGHVNVVTPLV